jgi:hypothetical protein
MPMSRPLAMGETLFRVGGIVLPEIPEPYTEGLCRLEACIALLVEEAAGSEISDYPQSIASREGRIMEGP